MKAVLLNQYGGVDQLSYQEVPQPVVKPDEVLVKVSATSINPVDYKLRAGHLKAIMPLTFPAILGRDVAGEVVEIGEAVTNLTCGDKVMGLVDHGYAEFLTAKASILTVIPRGLDEIAAAVLPLVTLTGAQLIENGVQPKKDDVVLVTGALGSVGRTAVFVAKQHGAKVIAGVRAVQKAEAQLLGADSVVALDNDNEISALPQLDAIADTVGGRVITNVLRRLRPGGRLATVVGKPESVDSQFEVKEVWAQPDPKRLHELAEEVRDGKLKIPVAKRFRLSEIRQAHAEAEAGGGGKIAILP